MKNPLTIISWLLLIAVMTAIFLFSSQVSEVSASISGGLIEKVLTLFDPDFSSLSAEEQLALVESYSFAVRKTAHFTVFALLGAFAYLSFKLTWSAHPLFALLFGIIYAVSDEVHQYFVPGRACQLRDILIDSAGVAAGILVVLGIFKLYRRRKIEK